MLWEKLRPPLLVAVFCSTVLVLGKLLFVPAPHRAYKIAPFTFPAKVSLAGWQLVASQPLTAGGQGSEQRASRVRQPPATGRQYQLLAGQTYQYRRQGKLLEINMRYLALGGTADVGHLIRQYTSISVYPIVRQQAGIGFYSLMTERQRAYLSACINPRGFSTVTSEQFNQNMYLYNVPPSRILPWVLGQQTLRDDRCLWSHLSIPIQNTSIETTYQMLESAWFSWYQWWSQNFPES